MSDASDTPPTPQSREARLKAALKANIAKRKQQARARCETAQQDERDDD